MQWKIRWINSNVACPNIFCCLIQKENQTFLIFHDQSTGEEHHLLWFGCSGYTYFETQFVKVQAPHMHGNMTEQQERSAEKENLIPKKRLDISCRAPQLMTYKSSFPQLSEHDWLIYWCWWHLGVCSVAEAVQIHLNCSCDNTQTVRKAAACVGGVVAMLHISSCTCSTPYTTWHATFTQ